MGKTNKKEGVVNYSEIENFPELLDESIYTAEGAAVVLSVGRGTVNNWIKEENPSIPNDENREKILKFIPELKKPENKRMKKHPSYGYATEAEIKRLKEIGICPEYTEIMDKITKRTRAKGKTK